MTLHSALIEPRWEEFRRTARLFIGQGVPPEQVTWTEATGEAAQLSLLPGASTSASPTGPAGAPRVPGAFLELAETVACHREPAAWPWLYRVLWRLTRGQRWLLDDAADPDVAALRSMERAVRRDAHKMTAFVRFRAVADADGERYVAWFEPRHRIVRRSAPFFERRFPSMRWSILTPDECVHWDGESLAFTPGVEREQAPPEDDLERFWLTYYAHTFNPARVRVTAMRSEMPVHYWRNMPETEQIGTLVRGAPARVREMIERAGLTSGGSARQAQAPGGAVPSGRSTADSLAIHLPDTSRVVPPPSTEPREQRPPAELQPTRFPDVRIGVAGWDYPDWAGLVYPPGRTGVDRLRWVAARFDLLEVNSTFYRPASERVVRRWLERTDDRPELQFSAKLSRRFTHDRGAWSDAEVEAVTRGMAPLLEAGKLLSLVVQFPWSFRAGADERRHLARIVRAFAAFPLHVEVRHASWELPAFHEWLRETGVGLVEIDQPIFADSIGPGDRTTSPLGYVRLHGRNARNWFRAEASRDERYDYSYSAEELRPWVERVRAMVARPEVEETAVVFNNHYRAQAVENADWFAEALNRPGGTGAEHAGEERCRVPESLQEAAVPA